LRRFGLWLELGKLMELYQDLHENDEKVPNDGTLKQVWENILSNSSFSCLGVFIGNRLVSSCCLVVIDNLTRGCRPYALIENVVTDKEFRRKGYGKKLLQHALTLAWESKCYKVMLQTSRLDEKTFLFYESVGFSRNAKKAFITKAPST